MSFLRITFKLLLFLVTVLFYILTSFFWRVWTQDLERRRRHYTRTVSFYCRWALWMMNFHIKTQALPSSKRSFLIVGNHLGMLDILVLSSQFPTLFITSVDMKETPGLGLLTEMGGCLYVERRSRLNIREEIQTIRQALRQGLSVTLYPEGTSSNGEKVLPFKKSLLVAAAGTGIPVLPVVINYKSVNGEPVSDKWRDYVCWYGKQTFWPALMRILSVRSVEVELEFCREIHVHSEDDRREIATRLYEVISSKYIPIPLPEKQAFS